MLRIERRRLFAMTIVSWFSAWLAPAKARARSFANIGEFRALVIAAFKRQPGVDSVMADRDDPAKFRITIGEWSSTGDLTNAFGHLKAYPDEDTEELVGRFIKSLVEARSRAIDDDKIVAVIRSREYLDYTLKMGLDVLNEPLGADLFILYMADQPDSMSPINSRDFPSRDLASVRKIALSNVRRWLPKVISDGQLGDGVLYYVEDNTMLSTSLILLEEFWKAVAARFPGDVLIALPRRDQLFLFDDGKSGRAHVRELIKVTIQENFNLLSPMLYACRNGKIVVVPD